MSADGMGDDPFSQNDQDRISDAIRAIAENRALIEQTKGALMFVYGIDADAAFDVLRQQSQQHNVKLRLIAEQILKDLVELSQSTTLANRLAFDGMMLTAHRRISAAADRQRDGQSKTDA